MKMMNESDVAKQSMLHLLTGCSNSAKAGLSMTDEAIAAISKVEDSFPN